MTPKTPKSERLIACRNQPEASDVGVILAGIDDSAVNTANAGDILCRIPSEAGETVVYCASGPISFVSRENWRRIREHVARETIVIDDVDAFERIDPLGVLERAGCRRPKELLITLIQELTERRFLDQWTGLDTPLIPAGTEANPVRLIVGRMGYNNVGPPISIGKLARLRLTCLLFDAGELPLRSLDCSEAPAPPPLDAA
jgi:hypothetical protein